MPAFSVVFFLKTELIWFKTPRHRSDFGLFAEVTMGAKSRETYAAFPCRSVSPVLPQRAVA
jgi:hypothetical protein